MLHYPLTFIVYRGTKVINKTIYKRGHARDGIFTIKECNDDR